MSRVGQRIKEARLKSNMTQKALAKKLGVAEKYINEVETGKKVVQESFIDKAGKILNADLNDVSMVVTDEALMEERKTLVSNSKNKKLDKVETSEVWSDAFASVLKSVPVYDYSLKNIKSKKEMPVYSNKIEGYTQDKVLYIEVSDNEMSGFRMLKGDLVFGHLVKELTSSGIYLVDYKGERKIRQIKNLGNSKVLLINDSGSVRTETMNIKEIEIVVKFERIEIKIN